MSVIVHLSDTHFGTEVAPVVRAVERAVLAIKPDIVTISGDITQRARLSQFRLAAAFLESLPAEIRFVIPGNHDIPLFNIPLRMIDPYYYYGQVFGLREGLWCHDNIGIIGFNATSRWRHTRGYIPDETLIRHIKEARSRLKPGAILIACAHQPLVVALPVDQENVLIHAERTAKLFAEHQVDLVLSGHVHMPIITTTQEAFPKLPRHFVLSGGGTAVSYRTRPEAPNSFNVIRISPQGQAPSIAITLMEYQQATEEFVSKAAKTFSLTPTGWRA
jgi:3',5'-cyclic AMP phosphodiesterase CpdA